MLKNLSTINRKNAIFARVILHAVMLWQLFWTFCKIGAFTIGGGYAMIPLIEREVVTRRGWLTSEEFLDLLVLAQMAPGVLAMNISIIIGRRLHGRLGAVVSALGSALPSFVIILIVAVFLNRFQDTPALQKMFRAVRPAVVALIAVPVFNLAKTAKITWHSVWIPIVVAFLIWYFGWSPVWLILAAGIGGVLYKLVKDKLAAHKQNSTK